MVDYNETSLDAVFGALSDPTRRAILEQLREGPATVGALASPHDITFQGVSKHLKKLEEAGLVRRRRSGREVHCELIAGPVRQAESWLNEHRRFWTDRLDRLEELLGDRKGPLPNATTPSTQREHHDGTDDD